MSKKDDLEDIRKEFERLKKEQSKRMDEFRDK